MRSGTHLRVAHSHAETNERPIGRRRTAALRGRDAELEVISEQLARASGAQGCVMLMDGPVGTGKTRLLAEVAAMARRNTFRVVTESSSSALVPMPFEPLLGALLDRATPPLPSEVLHGLPSGHDDRCRLVRGLQELIGEAALDRPLLIVLDDLHRASPTALSSLRTIIAGLAGTSVVWALSAATAESSRGTRTMLGGLVAEGGHRLRLGALSEAAVAGLLSDLIGDDPSPALVKLAARADGNPLLLVELLHGLVEDDMIAKDSDPIDLSREGLPSRVLELARRRLDGFGSATSQVLLVGAVLGRFSVEHLAQMLDVAPATLLGPIDEALRADMLVAQEGELAFRHDLLREAVVASLPASMCRSLRRQAAEVLMKTGAEPTAIASHMVASARPGDKDAVETLRRAAQALGGRDPDRAADLSRHAVRLAGDHDACLAELVAETVVLLDAADRHQEALAVARTVLDAVPSSEDEAHIRAALALAGPRPAGHRCAESRRALGLPGLSPATIARHNALLAMNLALAGDHADARSVLARGASSPEARQDGSTRRAAQVAEITLQEIDGRYDQALELVWEGRSLPVSAADKTYDGVTRVVHARLLALTGRVEEAIALSVVAVARAKRDRQSWLQTHAEGWHAHLLFQAGRLADAHGGGTTGHPLAPPLLLGRIALHTGDARQLRSSLQSAHELREHGDRDDRRRASWLLALAAFDDDRGGDALAWLDDDTLPYVILPSEETQPPTVARIALAAGRHDVAMRAVRRAELCAERTPGSAVLQGVAAHARGLANGDLDDLRRAVRTLRPAGRPLALAAALRDTASALQAAGMQEEAGRAGFDALELYEGMSATVDTRAVRRQLRSYGITPPGAAQQRPKEGWDSLTDSEVLVVSLVAEGRTNREAAQRLFLSPHTVSTHLRHAFVKLGINSRVELARIVVESDADRVPAA